jgi:hypothetical protein
MRALQISTLAFAVMLTALIGFNPAGAADAKDLKGWGLDDPYQKLYKFKESERLKATVVKVLEVTPSPGMSPGVALEVRDGSETIMVHLCPVGYAKPSEIGIKPGDKVSIRGSWAEVGGKDVFMAAKVKKGDTYEFKVRLSKDGTPFWTMTPEQLAKELQSKDD